MVKNNHTIMYIINSYGDKEWRLNGKLHREDGPAVIWSTGTQEWWVNGQRHRIDGPAVIWSTGTQEWLVNGQRHRIDGPALIWTEDDREEWYINGKLHREDGPAVIRDDIHNYYINGENITKEVLKWMRTQDITWPWDEESQTQFILTFYCCQE